MATDVRKLRAALEEKSQYHIERADALDSQLGTVTISGPELAALHDSIVAIAGFTLGILDRLIADEDAAERELADTLERRRLNEQGTTDASSPVQPAAPADGGQAGTVDAGAAAQ